MSGGTHDEFELFVTVVNQSGFSAAARSFGMTRSAVCRSLERLEARLGVRLLDRTTRRLKMTDAGEVLYQSAVRILEDIREAERATKAFQQEPKGVLRVASPVMIGQYIITPLMREFQACHPQITTNLTLSDDALLPVTEFDVTIGFGRQSDSALIAQKLGESRRVICASPDYIRERGMPKSPEDLFRHNCVLMSGLGAMSNQWDFKEPDGARSIRVAGNFVVNTGNANYEALLAGIGVGRATDLCIRSDIATGRLVVLLEEFEPAEATPIYALHLSRRHIPLKTRAFINFLKARFSAEHKNTSAPPENAEGGQFYGEREQAQRDFAPIAWSG